MLDCVSFLIHCQIHWLAGPQSENTEVQECHTWLQVPESKAQRLPVS